MEGTPFGPYRLLELLGRGRMGEVWRAYDTVTDRTVAVKVLPTQWALDEDFQSRFRLEASIAAKLTEPHIVPIHTYGEIDDRLFVDMQLIDGRGLDAILEHGPLDPARAVNVVEQIATALDAAHAVGLVHRDVKPSNILVANDDFAYLIDFGIARAADDTALTGTGQLIGTRSYMSPEQLNSGQADVRSDVYSLACVLYESLTAGRPFPGGSLEEQVTGHLTAPAPKPSAAQPSVPTAFDDVIATGLATDPAQRYQTTPDLARAARAAIDSGAHGSADLPPPAASAHATRRRFSPAPVKQTVRGSRSRRREKNARRAPLRNVLIALAVIAVLIVGSVAIAKFRSGGGHNPPSAGGSAEVGATNDMNPQDPATLLDGGALRLALTQFPENYNALDIDGNTGDMDALLKPTMPRAFIIAADGSATVNHDFFTNVELTGTNPQVVTYTINPKSVWSDGTPVTWEDIASQFTATNGKDKAYAIAGTNGMDRVGSVVRGVDDRQAIMTFDKNYADWKGIIAGNGMLFPKSVTSTPAAFNTGFLNGPPPSAGPFIISAIDKTAQRITLTRNPKWWGTVPRLDSINYLVLDDAARLPALQSNAIDATGLTSLDELTVAKRTAGIAIRRAPALSWNHFTFNGAPGSILADPALRRAIAKGIDRQTIANVTQRGLADNPAPLNNHIYVAGQQGYQGNSAVVAFDPEQGAKELDALGWRMNGQFREKDGRQLVIRDLFYDGQSTRQVAQIAQNSLAQIGVKLDLDAKGGAGFFSQYITVGNFDIAQFSWGADAFPLSSLTQIYLSTGESNFGKIGTPEIDAKIEQTLAELDPGRARALANELDKLVWAQGFSLPLTQSAGNVAVRSNLANFGAAGLADVIYPAIGFMKP